MRILYTKILDTFIEAGRRVNKVLVMGGKDGRTAPQLSPFGIDSTPIDNLRAVYVETPQKGKKAVLGYFDTNQISEKGETRVYSTNDEGDIETYIFVRNNGDIELGGTSDNAVRYLPLESGVNEIRDKLNDLIGKYNAHIHTAPSGATTTPLPPNTETPTMADISGAKIDQIKTL